VERHRTNDIDRPALRHWLARQTAMSAEIGYERQPVDFVFTTRLGTPVEPRNFFRSYMARIQKAGIRRITGP
jgi:hypothetical protein